MPVGVIHFVTETGQDGTGLPSKKRLSKINSHVARFSHNRRKHNKNSASPTISRDPSPLDVDFVVESPRSADHSSPINTPSSITSHPAQRVATKSDAAGIKSDLPERRRSTGSTKSKSLGTTSVIKRSAQGLGPHQGKPAESSSNSIIRRHSDPNEHNVEEVPRIGSLGSVLQLGNSVGLYEKYLLNYYFTELQTQMFGISKDAVYCFQRVPAARTIQQSPAALHWILVIAEQQMNKYAPEESKSLLLSNSILKRRANGYGLLRSLLNSPNFDVDQAIVTLRYATSAECFIDNAGACKEHLKAIDTLLQQPGSRERFAANEATALPLGSLKTLYGNAPVRITSANDFEAIKNMFFLSVRRIQSSSKASHAELVHYARKAYLTQVETAQDGMQVKRAPDYVPVSEANPLAHYISIKRTALFSTYVSETMNSRLDPQWQYSYQAGLFGLFYGLNMTLSSFGRRNLAGKTVVLERLSTLFEDSFVRSQRASSIMSFVDWVRKQYDSECLNQEERIAKDVNLCSYEINAQKLFALLDSNSRIKLTAALRVWLLSDVSMEDDLDKDDLSDEALSMIEEQVTQAWWKEHLAAKYSPSPSTSPEP